MSRKIRMGMIGGGEGAFIGSVHRMAAALDGQIELVAGAFSSDPEKSRITGQKLHLDPLRVYPTYEALINTEKNLPPDRRIDLVSIVTPNHLHFAPSKMALEAGFHVICDKPLTFNLEEAYALREVASNTKGIFALTHNYTGYPMVKQARQMIKNGELGTIRKVVAEYPQGWLSRFEEGGNNKQAAWRTDPSKSGIAGAIGDIGTHAENLAEYVTGLKIKSLCADISIMVEGRKLDDDGNILLRFDNGARGILYASQISAGEENNLKIRVYGTIGSIEWSQMEPNSLITRWLDRPVQVYRSGSHGLYPEALAHTRIPAGHPEGYLEAFANIYRNVAFCIRALMQNEDPDPIYQDFPTLEDGIRGMKFITRAIESGKSLQKWIDFD